MYGYVCVGVVCIFLFECVCGFVFVGGCVLGVCVSVHVCVVFVYCMWCFYSLCGVCACVCVRACVFAWCV